MRPRKFLRRVVEEAGCLAFIIWPIVSTGLALLVFLWIEGRAADVSLAGVAALVVWLAVFFGVPMLLGWHEWGGTASWRLRDRTDDEEGDPEM